MKSIHVGINPILSISQKSTDANLLVLEKLTNNLVEEIVEPMLKSKSEYLRHCERTEKLLSPSLSSALFNYYAKEEEKVHLPVHFWKKH